MKQSSSAPHSYSRSWELSLKSKAIASLWRLWCTSHHRNHNCHETVECGQSSWGIDEVLFWWFFWFHFGLQLDTVRSYYCRTPATSHKRAAIFAQFLRVSQVHGVVIWTRQGDGKLPEVDPFLTRLVPIPTCQNQTISQEKTISLAHSRGFVKVDSAPHDFTFHLQHRKQTPRPSAPAPLLLVTWLRWPLGRPTLTNLICRCIPWWRFINVIIWYVV